MWKKCSEPVKKKWIYNIWKTRDLVYAGEVKSEDVYESTDGNGKRYKRVDVAGSDYDWYIWI